MLAFQIKIYGGGVYVISYITINASIRIEIRRNIWTCLYGDMYCIGNCLRH